MRSTLLRRTLAAILLLSACTSLPGARPVPGSSGGQTNGGATSTGGTSGSGGTGGSGGQGSTQTSAPILTPSCDSIADGGIASNSPWDWNGVVGTGQSLAVGAPPSLTTTQPYHNLKLSLGGVAVPPWDPSSSAFTMVPLVEPLRALATGYPAPYPGNVWGETPTSAMANEITFQAKCTSPDSDYVSVHTMVGESGQGIVALGKQTGDTTGSTGRAYAATLFEAQAIARLAKAAGASYGIAAIMMTHGETDSGSSTYQNDLIQLLADYNADLSAITGQMRKIPMYLSQQHAYPGGVGQRPVSNIVQWQLGVLHKGEFVCTGPKYQYPANSSNDGVHLSPLGYQMLGEKYGQIYFQREVLGSDWQPLQPISVERSGRVVTVHFHVPVLPLVWDESLDPPAIAAWASGRGFELRTSGTQLAIVSVAIAGDTVQITAAADLPASGLVVGYALSSQGVQMKVASKAVRWGQLRDSDPFVGSSSKLANPNYAVSFEMPVP